MTQKHKVFISYHHENDQTYKKNLLKLNKNYDIFIDQSVDTGDIDDGQPVETIRTKIRDEYLKDTTVTVVLVGAKTWCRKYIDWEIYSSMYDGAVNKKSGILVINLPYTESFDAVAAHGDEEKKLIYPNETWISLNKSDCRKRYPDMPERIMDNLLTKKAKISVVPWRLVEGNPKVLGALIEFTHNGRRSAEYDLSRPMRRQDCQS